MRIDPIIDIRIHIYAGTRRERERGRERGGGGGEKRSGEEKIGERRERERVKLSALIKNNHTTTTDHIILPVHKLHILLKESTFLFRPEHPQQAARREVLFMKRISQLLERLKGIKKIIKIIKMAKIDNALRYYRLLRQWLGRLQIHV